MLFLKGINQRRLGGILTLLVAASLALIIFYPVSRLYLVDRISNWRSPTPPTTGHSPDSPDTPDTPDHPDSPSEPVPEPVPQTPDDTEKPLPLPAEYDFYPPQAESCEKRLSTGYIDELRDHAVAYCSPGTQSNITCFHGSFRTDGQLDSMCYVSGAALNTKAGRFVAECNMRHLSRDEKNRGLIDFQQIRPYWYETGPPEVFKSAIGLAQKSKTPSMRHRRVSLASREEKPEQDSAHNEAEGERAEGTATESDGPESSTVVELMPPAKNYLLLKREGEGNPWHCFMEILSTYLSFDVLQASRDPSHPSQEPYFRDPEDIEDTQVVILDDRADGPYMDLWKLFARRKPIRMKELLKDPAVAANPIRDANLIIPLAGGSNPLWEDDWEVQQCSRSSNLDVFSRRVLGFLEVQDPKPRKTDDPIKVTFIDRRSSRRLRNQEALFEKLKARNSFIKVEFVDFAAMSFKDQLKKVRETDVLVGVHGAGLTHTMFMRGDAGAVVEIQPEKLHHYGFRNIANLRRLNYFRTHAPSVDEQKKENKDKPKENKEGTKERARRQLELDELDKEEAEWEGKWLGKRAEWHFKDVEISEENFLKVVEAAISSMYSKGLWNYDIT